jgi:pyruvate-formate lyase-activating enzyme
MPRKKQWIKALAADADGEIFELEGYAAVGMAGLLHRPLTAADTINMPYGGELMMLPGRRPTVCRMSDGVIEELVDNPYAPGEPIFPVAVFNSPGYVNTFTAAYREDDNARLLPLFSYAAVGWYRGHFRTAALCVDRERRQDLRLMPRDRVLAGVEHMRRIMPDNRLRLHLETCALVYGCPAGKNFFLGRCEAPLPTATACNARCLGCISLQQDSGISSCQQRIAFTPTPEEIAQVALAHIRRVRRPVVSFGQGCEGDPLLAAHVIAPAISLIRRKTRRGTINLNTNASLPEALEKLIDAGLDSLRVSMNSVREETYSAYFRPTGYRFADVLASVGLALARGCHVAVNYLNCPGVTDSAAEAVALEAFLQTHPIHLIQWRNLNYDPLRYFQAMESAEPGGPPMGMARLLARLRRRFPRLRHGYFNPHLGVSLKK